jgi:hypothetical protein
MAAAEVFPGTELLVNSEHKASLKEVRGSDIVYVFHASMMYLDQLALFLTWIDRLIPQPTNEPDDPLVRQLLSRSCS